MRWMKGALVGLGLAATGCADSRPTTPQDPIQVELDEARTALARYQDVAVALQDGFVPDAFCVASPAGAMGIHYLNPARVDGRLAPGEPELLLYMPEAGRLRLVALEYLLPAIVDGRPYFGDAAPAPTALGTHPVLFGQRFDGPMPGHIATQPWHYDLHVWLGAHNPAGLYAAFNPALRCP